MCRRSAGAGWTAQRPERRRGLDGDVAVEPGRGGLVALWLHVAVGVGGLADARVTQLRLHPAEVGAVAEQPRRERTLRWLKVKQKGWTVARRAT